MTKAVADLQALLGESAVIDDPAQMSAYLNEPRKRFHVPAAAVVRPADVAQVQPVQPWRS